MKIIITGGSGFIGYHLALTHALADDDVFIIDNLFKNEGTIDQDLSDLLKRDNVKLIKVDLTKNIDLNKIPDNIDIFYHLAAINGTELFYTMPFEVATVNLSMTLILVRLFENKKINKIVFSSTSEVYAGGYELNMVQIPTDENAPVVFPQPTDIRFSYATSKFMSEFIFLQYGKKFNTSVAVIRYHNIYGPRMGSKHVVPELISRLLNGQNPLIVYGANETRAFCFISDAIKATIAVAVSNNTDQEIIHIGNQYEEIAIEKLAKVIMDVMQVDVKIEFSPGKSSSVPRRCPNTHKLKTLTGYESKVQLHDGIKETYRWYRDN